MLGVVGAGAPSVWRGLTDAERRFAWVTGDRWLPPNRARMGLQRAAGAGDHVALPRLAQARPDEAVRDVIGDLEAVAMAVARVRASDCRDPGRFDRLAVNRRLRGFAEGDKRWRERDDDHDPGHD